MLQIKLLLHLGPQVADFFLKVGFVFREGQLRCAGEVLLLRRIAFPSFLLQVPPNNRTLLRKLNKVHSQLSHLNK